MTILNFLLDALIYTVGFVVWATMIALIPFLAALPFALLAALIYG